MSEKSLSRRSFLQWSALGAGAIGASGLVACASGDGAGEGGENLAETGLTETGEWKFAPCYNNCSCGASRCVNKVYIEDGVPLKIRSDEAADDTFTKPQRRSCLRGRAKISEVYSPARIKYPMKRKNFSLDNPQGELRGKDEWERISWEEALDLVAEGIKKMMDQYGPKGILCGASSNIGDGYYDQNVCLLNALGGSVHAEAGTVSFGSWHVANMHMLGNFFGGASPHINDLKKCDLHVMFGNNWVSNKSGNYTWYMNEARKSGSKMIIIDPWLNQTASVIADEWVPVLPGTDTALIQAICYEWINAGTFDQEFLDKYCIGFDDKTLPETAPANGDWKNYILGTSCYDNVPKTPEWAEAICGVPADRIRELAAEIAAADKVHFFCGQSVSKIPAGEQLVQSFETMAFMHGGIGTSGHFFHKANISYAGPNAMALGSYCPLDADPANPLQPEGAPIYMWYPIPNFTVLKEDTDWLNLEPSECWRSIKAGEYGRDCWPGGKKKVDIHAAYFGGHMSTLNQIPDTMTGIEVVRGFDFVWGCNPFFDSTRQYCDVLLPCPTFYEKPNKGFGGDTGSVMWFDNIIEPLYEAKPESWIAEELATRLGLDPRAVNGLSDADRTYATVRDAVYMEAGAEMPSPLLTITQEEIDTYFPEASDAAPQEGKFTFEQFRNEGILKTEFDESYEAPNPYAAFFADPEANPLPTASGKFEIYCEALAFMINSVGYSTVYPIGVYQIGDPEQGAGTQTDEFPLLLWTPHSLRRAHSVNDNVSSLRQAFPQECFMSEVDAEARGIKNGDVVLMSSPHGKVLRHAKVTPYIVPGAVAIQDGAWFEIDEETGIDIGGCPNVLQAPKSSGGGSQSWCGTLLQVEKYDGPLTLEADWARPVVTPVGIAE